MKNLKTVKSALALALALVCCLALAACSSNDAPPAAPVSAAPVEIFTGSITSFNEPAPGYALVGASTQNLQIFADGTYLLTVTDVSMTNTDGSLLSLFHTTVAGNYTAGEVDEDTGYQTITLVDTTKVYASGDIYNMFTKKASLKTETWSDDASLTDAERTELLDTFGISNVVVEVNTQDNTFQVFTFNSTGIVDMESSVY